MNKKILLLTLATFFIATSVALCDPPSMGKHGGFVSASSGFTIELVTKREDENVQFICYVSDGNDGYLTTGSLVLTVVCPDGRTLELEARPSSNYFTASTKIHQRGAFQIQETYAPDVGPIAVTSARKNI